MIRHTVTFKLKPALDFEAIANFFAGAKKLADIPGVQHFECLKQVSQKNAFEYGLSMEFANQALEAHYANHPYHGAFVQQHWLQHVEDFLEIDYEPLVIAG